MSVEKAKIETCPVNSVRSEYRQLGLRPPAWLRPGKPQRCQNVATTRGDMANNYRIPRRQRERLLRLVLDLRPKQLRCRSVEGIRAARWKQVQQSQLMRQLARRQWLPKGCRKLAAARKEIDDLNREPVRVNPEMLLQPRRSGGTKKGEV